MTTMMTARTVAIAAVVAAGMLAVGRDAHAGQFDVAPTRLDLGDQTRAGMLDVDNHGTEAMRFQVTVVAWGQAADGSPVLVPTTDVIATPAVFELPAGETRHVRVGTRLKAGASERSYRVLVEELPPPRHADQVGVRVLTRMSVPIFVAPDGAAARGAITGADLSAQQLTVRVGNTGTAHAKLAAIKLHATDASGATVLDREVAGWYVLAGATASFPIALDHGQCERVSRVELEAIGDAGSWRRSILVQPGACTR